MNVWFGLVVSGSLGSQQPLVKGLVECLARVVTGTWCWLAWWFRRNLQPCRCHQKTLSPKHLEFQESKKCTRTFRDHLSSATAGFPIYSNWIWERDDFLPCGGALFWDRLIYIYICNILSDHVWSLYINIHYQLLIGVLRVCFVAF